MPPRSSVSSAGTSTRRLLAFDVDHALCTYKQPAFSQLVYGCIIRFLVEKRSYPRCLQEDREYEGFCGKGLVFDTETGCMLKLDANGDVAMAYLGSEPVDSVSTTKSACLSDVSSSSNSSSIWSCTQCICR